jgi:hypothetical protein
MVRIKIKTWDTAKAWTNWSGQAKRQFVNRTRVLSSADRTELKRLARKVLNRETVEFSLDRISDLDKAEPLVHLLESLGAMVEVQSVT